MDKHYWYGSGMVGCLFDYGPEYGGTDLHEAIDAALFIFETCEGETTEETEEVEYEIGAAKAALIHDGIHYFAPALRPIFGADYVEVWAGGAPGGDDE
jgi:hypothetical protein